MNDMNNINLKNMSLESMKEYYKKQMINYHNKSKAKGVNRSNEFNRDEIAVPAMERIQPAPIQPQPEPKIQQQTPVEKETKPAPAVTDMTLSVEKMYEMYKKEHPMTGYIKVQAFSARRTYPVPNATVEIGKNFPQGRFVIATLKTDSSGLTETIPVPAAKKELSLEPGVKQPYSAFDIYVKHPKFADMKFYDVEVYQDIVSTQVADMVPYSVVPQDKEEIDIIEKEPRDL